MQSGDSGHFTVDEQLKTFQKALSKPVDKLAYIHKWIPSTRFMEDYIFHPSLKLLKRLEIVGFTLNPEHSQVNWSSLVRGVPNLRLVLFVRGNLMKIAISGTCYSRVQFADHRCFIMELSVTTHHTTDIRGQRMKQQCGSSNLKTTMRDCHLPEQLHLPTTGTGNDAFLQNVFKWQVWALQYPVQSKKTVDTPPSIEAIR